jgi:hypothetical protein
MQRVAEIGKHCAQALGASTTWPGKSPSSSGCAQTRCVGVGSMHLGRSPSRSAVIQL